jgi:type VI protein secretion system component VasK
MFDSAQMRPVATEKTVLTFRKPPHSVEITVDALSVNNPFGNRTWQKFSCGG